ncbi:hypothetical protein MTBSS4_530007 [Magnetospirillum sp. SS-4]|nr:hypothetical protein MTBSS4_530007 [Magnetospirillum sp. SS-4]
MDNIIEGHEPFLHSILNVYDRIGDIVACLHNEGQGVADTLIQASMRPNFLYDICLRLEEPRLLCTLVIRRTSFVRGDGILQKSCESGIGQI